MRPSEEIDRVAAQASKLEQVKIRQHKATYGNEVVASTSVDAHVGEANGTLSMLSSEIFRHLTFIHCTHLKVLLRVSIAVSVRQLPPRADVKYSTTSRICDVSAIFEMVSRRRQCLENTSEDDDDKTSDSCGWED
ncbi:wiskott Aldrich syndrome protein family member [Echinococcus multilocularis]|uniref:Wiskott Aldrich syndrome protein family member n=1 Tax=Echinococcus multilocularis TaxID=6211 RepID=A0A0S4MKG0_ECHMU|nr:wiskott Aldrich syndrome protein family member [Echinococcus multilocularis]